METKSNLETVFQAMSKLDVMISGTEYENMDMSKDCERILRALFDHAIGNQPNIHFNQYILNTFNCYRAARQQIEISSTITYAGTRILFDIDESGSDGVMFELGSRHITDESKFKSRFNSELLKVFPNVTTIRFRRATLRGLPKFSLTQFLSVIKDTAIQHVCIEQSYWCGHYTLDLKKEIIDKYEQANFKIDFRSDEPGFPEEINISSLDC